MAHLWKQAADGTWIVNPLDRDVAVLADLPADRAGAPDDRHASAVIAIRADSNHASSRIVMAGRRADLRINGIPVLGGIRLLCDRDQISVDDDCVYFSTETLPEVVGYPSDAAPLSCARCRQALEADTRAVKCPQCGVWHHQSDALPCWTYAETCALCPQPTDLAAGYRWTPNEL